MSSSGRKNDKESYAEQFDRLLTGEGRKAVDVTVEVIPHSEDAVIEHNLKTVNDFDPLDFYMPLVLLILVFILQSGPVVMVFGPMMLLVALGMQVLLLYDLFKRSRRRASSRQVTGMVPPYKSRGYGYALGIYFACLPFLAGAIWVNIRLVDALFPQWSAFRSSLFSGNVMLFVTIGLVWLLVNFFLTVVFAPLTEEIWFRGIGLAGFLKTGSRGRATIITSLIFGILHGPNRFLFTTLFGFLLAFLRFRTGSLYCCMLVHAVHNFLAFLLGVYLMAR